MKRAFNEKPPANDAKVYKYQCGGKQEKLVPSYNRNDDDNYRWPAFAGWGGWVFKRGNYHFEQKGNHEQQNQP